MKYEVATVLNEEMLQKIKKINIKKLETLPKVVNAIRKIIGFKPALSRKKRLADLGWGMKIDEYLYLVSAAEQIRITTEYETDVMLIEIYKGGNKILINDRSRYEEKD